MAEAVVGVMMALFLPLLVSYFFHWFQDSVDNPEVTPTFETGPVLGALALNLVSLTTTAALIIYAIWAFNGPKTAEALGRRPTHSPGRAAAGWFVPIVNYWFPYQAVRDLVPDAHPIRPRVIVWWIGHLLAPLTIVFPVVAALFSVPIAMLFAIVPITAAVGTAVLGRRIATAVGEGFDEAARSLAGGQTTS